jgi:Nuclease A inhibitor-like protein
MISSLPSPSLETEALIRQLETAVTDLVWTSEIDAPFDVALWAQSDVSPSPKQVLQQAQLPSETPVQQLKLEDFLAPVLQASDSLEFQEAANQFQILQDRLNRSLREIRVYRCSEIEIEIYILGQAPSGDWIMLHTAAVET